MSVFWTDERVAELDRLVGEGLSASQIARELGAPTRNVIIGKIHRLKLGGRTVVQKPQPSTKPLAERRIRTRPAPTVATDDRALRCEPAAGPLVGLLDLTRDSCRWPSGTPGQPGFGFCGGMAVEGRPYCAHHQQIATDRRPAPRLDEAERERRRQLGRQNVIRWRHGRGVSRAGIEA